MGRQAGWLAPDLPQTPSIDFPLEKLLFDGLFAGFAIRQVEAKVCPFVRSAPIRDRDGVADSEMHGFHDALPLQLSGSPDGDGGGVAAGTEELLAAVIVALLQILEAPPDDHAVLLRDLQGCEILPRDEGVDQLRRTDLHPVESLGAL